MPPLRDNHFPRFRADQREQVLRGQQARRKILEKWKLRLRQPRCHDIKAFWISSESQTQTRSISSCGEAKSKSFFLEDFHLCRSRLDKDLKLCVKCKCNFCNQVIVIVHYKTIFDPKDKNNKIVNLEK